VKRQGVDIQVSSRILYLKIRDWAWIWASQLFRHRGQLSVVVVVSQGDVYPILQGVNLAVCKATLVFSDIAQDNWVNFSEHTMLTRLDSSSCALNAMVKWSTLKEEE
jgi:hypothetical protein